MTLISLITAFRGFQFWGHHCPQIQNSQDLKIWGYCNLNPTLSTPILVSMPRLYWNKRLWCWEGLEAGGEGDDRGWDGWMASLTRWTWVWVNSRSWWWTGRPRVLRFMGSQRVRHNWATELNWTELNVYYLILTLNFLSGPPSVRSPSSS